MSHLPQPKDSADYTDPSYRQGWNDAMKLVRGKAPTSEEPQTETEAETRLGQILGEYFAWKGEAPWHEPTGNYGRMKEKLQALIDQERKKAAIEELAAYPLNWALNRKDKTWEMMVRSRIAELEGGEQ
jgi:hypothetical protein